MQTLNIVIISGSLREGSLNTALARTLIEMAPNGLRIELADIVGIEIYNQDVEKQGIPENVAALADRVVAADGIIFATPEYNYSIPGGLKNAIDWLSRLKPQPLAKKPVGIVGASMGALGTARAQYHLRQTLVFLDAYAMNKPEVFVAAAHTKFDETGRLTDDATRKVLASFLDSFASFVSKAKVFSPEPTRQAG